MRQSTAADLLDLATCHKHLGIVSAELGDLKTAEDSLRSGRALLLQDCDKDDPDVIDIDNHLADILRRTGRPEEARDLLVHVIQVRERIVGPHPDLAGSLQRYGATLAALGDYATATEALKRAQAMFADRMGADHPYVAEASVTLAAVLRDAGEPSAALDQAEPRSIHLYRCLWRQAPRDKAGPHSSRCTPATIDRPPNQADCRCTGALVGNSDV